MHLLIVDDDAGYRRLLRLGLERAGHVVEEAGSGAEALAVATAKRPCVVLLDFELPDMQGPAVCAKLKTSENLPALRVVMVTGRTEHSARAECFEAGADDYVSKPFSLRRLLLCIRALTEPPPGIAP